MLMVQRHSSAKQFKRIATGKCQFVKLIDMFSLYPLWFQFHMKPFETIRNRIIILKFKKRLLQTFSFCSSLLLFLILFPVDQMHFLFCACKQPLDIAAVHKDGK